MRNPRAGGNGEQSISRDVHRLGDRLDWFRLMSWYHSGIGFFINSTLTMASVYLAVWLVFFFSLTDSLAVRAGKADAASALRNEGELISTINTVQLFQLGLLSVIPYWGELCLETGFLEVRPRRPGARMPARMHAPAAPRPPPIASVLRPGPPSEYACSHMLPLAYAPPTQLGGATRSTHPLARLHSA